MAERMKPPMPYMESREAKIALSKHLRKTFRDVLDPYTTSGTIKEYMESPSRYLNGRRPVDILRSGNSREIDRIHFDLYGIDTAAFA